MDFAGVVAVCCPERHILRLLQVNLERQGYRVSLAQSGAQLFKLMSAEPSISLFVLDSALESPTADDIIKTIRADKHHSAARIIVLGSESNDDSRGGPDVFITKGKTLSAP
jgi:two-component system, OmpR family, alkaline phosphatase synthesis response regulator PhoP